MQVACPVCWHSVITPVICQSCGLVQCLEYEGPVCIGCGGVCKIRRDNQNVEVSGGSETFKPKEEV